MSKHTEGPWRKGTLQGFENRIYPIDAYNTVRGGPICEVFDKPFDDGSLEANARLIAAAPEMLAMLKKCRRTLIDIDGFDDDNEGLIREIEDVIKRAKGEG
jgi:hypothetical protein